MFKRIIVPIDNSKAGKLALSKAIELSQMHKAKLCIVHVIDYIALSAKVEGTDHDLVHQKFKTAAQKLLPRGRRRAIVTGSSPPRT